MKIELDVPRRVAAWIEDQPGGASRYVTLLVERIAGFRSDAGGVTAGHTDTRRAIHPPDCMCEVCRRDQEVEERIKVTLPLTLMEAVEAHQQAESLSQGDALRFALRAGLGAIRAREDGAAGLVRGRAATGGNIQIKVRLTRDLALRLRGAAKLARVNLSEASRQAIEAGLSEEPERPMRAPLKPAKVRR